MTTVTGRVGYLRGDTFPFHTPCYHTFPPHIPRALAPRYTLISRTTRYLFTPRLLMPLGGFAYPLLCRAHYTFALFTG